MWYAQQAETLIAFDYLFARNDFYTLLYCNTFQHIVCGHNTNASFIVEVIYEAGLVCIGCILAYQTRHLDKRFGGSKSLIFAMHNIALVGGEGGILDSTECNGHRS